MYKKLKTTPLSGSVQNGIETVQRISDGAFIPFDPDNTDYQVYLKWLEEGNQPLPADQPSQE